MPSTSSRSEPHLLTGTTAMYAVAAELTVIFILSTLPTPLYVIYQQSFHFSQILLTLVYAAYVVGTVTTMFFFGRLSDQVGRRIVVLVSLGIAAASALVFICATSIVWLFAGRVLSGVAIALASGASTAWAVELEPQDDKATATDVALGANMLGLGLGCLLPGVLAQYAPGPLILSYVVFLVLLVPVALLVWRSQKTIRKPKALSQASMRPRLGVPREIRARFVSPAIAAFAIFSVLGFYTALIPSLLDQAWHNTNHAVAGALVGALFFAGIGAIIVERKLDRRTGLIVALVLLVPGVALMVAAEIMHSMATLVIGTVVSGVATGWGYLSSVQRVNEMAPDNKRSEVVSSYLIVCYGGVSLPVIGVAVLSQMASPIIANTVFAVVTVTLAMLAFVTQIKMPHA